MKKDKRLKEVEKNIGATKSVALTEFLRGVMKKQGGSCLMHSLILIHYRIGDIYVCDNCPSAFTNEGKKGMKPINSNIIKGLKK